MTEMEKQKLTGPLNDGILHTRNLILRLMCLIYMIAFATFYYQSPGKLFMLLSVAKVENLLC